MLMLIDGIPAEQIVQKSVQDGLVVRPIALQQTLAPDERQELSDTILAARRRMHMRQKHLNAHEYTRQCCSPGTVTVDGLPANVIAAESVRLGLAHLKTRRKILSFAEIQQKAERQRRWVRESTRRWRAKKKAELEAQAVLVEQVQAEQPSQTI